MTRKIPRSLTPFLWLGKLAVLALMLLYVFIGSIAAQTAYSRYLYSRQDIETLPAFIKESVENGNAALVTVWMNARPPEETDALLRIVTPLSAELQPMAFFELFRREQARGRMEEALFWLQLGRYRLRYDALRCGGKPEDAQALEKPLKALPSKKMEAYLHANPGMLKKALQRVLDFDAQYPAHDDPTHLCQAVHNSVPYAEPSWEMWRKQLRQSTEAFIASHGMTPAPEKTTTPKKP